MYDRIKTQAYLVLSLLHHCLPDFPLISGISLFKSRSTGLESIRELWIILLVST